MLKRTIVDIPVPCEVVEALSTKGLIWLLTPPQLEQLSLDYLEPRSPEFVHAIYTQADKQYFPSQEEIQELKAIVSDRLRVLNIILDSSRKDIQTLVPLRGRLHSSGYEMNEASKQYRQVSDK